MAFNGSGTFVLLSPQYPAVPDTLIEAEDYNDILEDLATGLSTCMTKDGQTPPTQNIPMNSKKLTGLGAPTVAGDALSFGAAATISTLTLTSALAVAQGGTGATTAAGARTNLSAVGLTGNETVAGNKTFSGTSTFSGSAAFNGAVTMGSGAISIGSSGGWTSTSGDMTLNNGDIDIVSGQLFVSGAPLLSTSGGGATISKSFADSGNVTIAGHDFFGAGIYAITCGSGVTTPVTINRQANDGNLIEFRQANTTEGTISVSGTTVTYGTFLGSHWSQMEDGSKPELLKGTILESLDALCAWPNEDNDKLPRCKVSNTAGTKSVYGVFLGWDTGKPKFCGLDKDRKEIHEPQITNDLFVAALGAGWIRIQRGQTVARGDLIESAGDGTGRVQADDVMRSSTVGKVTSTVVAETYADGSFLVPCTLHCG